MSKLITAIQKQANMKQISVGLPEQTLSEVTRLSKALKVTKSGLLNTIIQQQITELNKQLEEAK